MIQFVSGASAVLHKAWKQFDLSELCPIPKIIKENWDGMKIFLVNKLLKQSLAIAKSGLYYDENFKSVYINNR